MPGIEITRIGDSLLGASTACALAAAALAAAQAWRTGTRSATWNTLGMLVVAAWVASIALFVSAPMSRPRASLSLALLALSLGAWPQLIAALAMRDGGGSGVPRVLRWAALVSPVAVVAVASVGIDWLTGIGPEPVVVLSRAGVWAMALAGIPALTAGLALFAQFAAQWARAPRLLLGLAGVMSAQLVLWASAVHSGYLSADLLAMAVPVCAAAMVLWLCGLVWEAPAAPRLALSRRFVYSSVGAAVLLAYMLAAGVAFKLRLLEAAVAGHAGPAAIFVGLALFVLAWARWRHPLRVALNRHVFGGKYDYGEVWIRLAAIVSRARGLPDLVQQTADYCRESLGVAEVSVWVSGPAGEQHRAAVTDTGASDDAAMSRLPPEVAGMDEAGLAEVLQASFVSPIRVGGHLLGLLVAGSATRPVSLDDEDRELLRHIAAQLAGALGIYRLGEDLADAREMASFHRLSGFLVHDLKNLAVQQSLVLENAKRHGRDPRFIRDALAAFEDSTRRMRALIGKLRTGPAETAPAHTGVCDVREVVTELLATVGVAQTRGCPVGAIVPDDNRPCVAVIEAASLLQVLRHLTANAIESLPDAGGSVSIAVRRLDDGGCRIEVTDDGCGVSPEYLREHAFRPFRTTKEGGLGVGLYQCKTIVEAVGGCISMTPAAGRGTTVTITLQGFRAPAAYSEVA